MGAPFDMYLLDDLANSKMADYKRYIFLNAFQVNKSIRAAVMKKVKRNDAVVVWCYASGYISIKGYGLDGMEKLTGIKFSRDNTPRTRILSIINKTSPITKYVRKSASFKIAPVFFAADSKVKVPGTVDNKPARER